MRMIGLINNSLSSIWKKKSKAKTIESFKLISINAPLSSFKLNCLKGRIIGTVGKKRINSFFSKLHKQSLKINFTFCIDF